jgi:hypothetical protein
MGTSDLSRLLRRRRSRADSRHRLAGGRREAGARTLSDEQLIAYVEWLFNRRDAEGLDRALEELVARIRQEEERFGDRPDLEKDIARLRSQFTLGDGDDGPDSLGVREPRRSPPDAGSDGATLELPQGRGKAA